MIFLFLFAFDDDQSFESYKTGSIFVFNNIKINVSLAESLCLFLVCFINRAVTAGMGENSFKF